MNGNGKKHSELLKRKADEICNLIMSPDSLWEQVQAKIGELHSICEKKFPENLELFEKIYISRFKKLWEEWKTPQQRSSLGKTIFDSMYQIGVILSYTQLQKFELLVELIQEWSNKINITSIKNTNEIIEDHFIDSCIPYRFFDDKQYAKILDVGSGAGFPGVPLQIICPSLKITLLEATKKKTEYLKIVKDKLALTNCEIISERAEILARDSNHRGKYDVIITRALAKLNTLLELCVPFLKLGGHLLAYKSKNVEIELKDAKNVFDILGVRLDNITETILPNSLKKRKILIIRKVKSTDLKYPRKNGIPQKRPLK